MGLTKKRRIVLANYTSDPDMTLEAALIKAGYSAKRATITACELKRDPEFIEAIERKQTQALEKLQRGELTDEEVINGIRDIEADCKAAGQVAGFLGIRLKCYELLAKIRGMFIEKVEFGFGAEIGRLIQEARERAKLPGQVIEATFMEDKKLQ